MFRLIDYEPSKNDDYNDMPVEHVLSLEYLISIIVLYCVLAAFCQLFLLNEYCIVLYVTVISSYTSTSINIFINWFNQLGSIALILVHE